MEDREEKEKELIPVGEAWNTFIGLLIVTESAWEAYKRKVEVLESEEIENLTVALQNVVANYREQKFEIMLPRFVDYWRGAGGLEEMKLSDEDIFEEI